MYTFICNAAEYAGDINIWDVQTGQCIHTMPINYGGVLRLSLSQDESMIASLGAEKNNEGTFMPICIDIEGRGGGGMYRYMYVSA